MKVRIALALSAALLAACASTTRPGAVGVTRQQLLLVPAQTVESMALTHYADQNSKARKDGKLVESGPEYDRLRAIANRLIPQTAVYRDDTRRWRWALTLIDAPTVNATCAPGGKITFYTGLVRQLQLTDDEIAAVMGHEIAHAVREHGREKVSQSMGQQLAVAVAAGRGTNPVLVDQFATIAYGLPNSREQESEADRMGLELMARAGYNPQAAITLWQKMAANAKGSGTPAFLSTHPSHDQRIAELHRLQPVAAPLYEQARAAR